MPVTPIQLSTTNAYRPLSMRLSRLCLLFVLAALTSACGYHLRGAYALPNELKNIYLEGATQTLREQFSDVLKSSSGQLLKSPAGAGVVVRIFNEKQQRRVLSLSSRGKSNEFELEYRLEFELSNAGNAVLMPREPIEIRRAYYNDQQDIIAKDKEEAVIRNEMLQQVVRNIMNRARVVLEATAK